MSGQRIRLTQEDQQDIRPLTPVEQERANTVQPAPSVGKQIIDTGLNTLGNAALTILSPLLSPLQLVRGLIDFPLAVSKGMTDQSQKAFNAFGEGRNVEGALRSLASAVPFVGPMTADYFDTDQAGREQIAGGVIGGLGIGRMPLPGMSSWRKGMDPRDARAVDAARAEGVPVNVGVATGNRPLQSMGQIAEKTTATGAGAVNRSRLATAASADRMGSDLAAQTGGRQVTLPQAGEGAATALEQAVTGHRGTAQQAYSIVEQAEAAGRVPAVSFTQVRTLLKPLHDYLTQLNDATGGLDAATGHGRLKADLDAIMLPNVERGYGYVAGDVPVMMAERILGNVKESLRKTGGSGGATTGQLKTIIRVLQGQIDNALSADPSALAAMRQGRLSTAQQYQAQSLLDKVAGKDKLRSPVTAAEHLMSDAGVQQLRRIAVQTPDAVRDLGRGWFESQFKEARAGNGFDLRGATRAWRAMPDETKQIAFREAIRRDPRYLQRVDDFFRATELIGENMNPSGTAAATANYMKLLMAPFEAVVGVASGHPAMGVGAAAATVGQDLAANAFARAMNNPRVVQLMVDGIRLPATAARARNIASVQAMLNAGVSGAGPVGVSTGGAGRSGGAGPRAGLQGDSAVVVTGRDGKTYTFPSQAQADAFQRAGG